QSKRGRSRPSRTSRRPRSGLPPAVQSRRSVAVLRRDGRSRRPAASACPGSRSVNRQAFALAAVALALQPSPFHTRVQILTVDGSVTRGDAVVPGLTADDFVVTDDGIRQRIDTATVERVPLSVTLVLDTSESVAGERLDALISASEQVVNELRTGDYVSLI